MTRKPVYTVISAILLALSLVLVACGAPSEPTTSDPNKATTANNSANTAPDSTTSENNEPTAEQSNSETASETTSDVVSSANEGESSNFLTSGMEIANPSQVQITSGWYIDEETGFLHVMGSVTNNTNTPISGVISFVYYDANGQPITVEALETAESDTVSFSAPIAPGNTGYYDRPRDLSKVQGEIASVEATLKYAVLETVSPVVEFSDLQWENTADAGVAITGLVKNSGATACVYPSLVIAYLKGGEVVGIGGYPLEAETLEPGGAIEFAFNEYFPPAEFDEVDVVIDCMPTSFPRP